MPAGSERSRPVAAGHQRPDSSKKRYALMVALGAVALDQLTKAIAIVALVAGPSHVGIIHLRLVANRGILLGMIGSPTWLITFVTVAIIGVALRAGLKREASQSVAYALLSAGAVGNLIDRYLHRPDFVPNAVVDWLSFGGMTFNLADGFIVAGALLLLGRDARRPAIVPT